MRQIISPIFTPLKNLVSVIKKQAWEVTWARVVWLSAVLPVTANMNRKLQYIHSDGYLERLKNDKNKNVWELAGWKFIRGGWLRVFATSRPFRAVPLEAFGRCQEVVGSRCLGTGLGSERGSGQGGLGSLWKMRITRINPIQTGHRRMKDKTCWLPILLS